MGKIKRLALLVFLLVIASLLPGCNSILQPSREELAEASFFITEDPVTLDIHIELLRGDTVMYYDTAVLQAGAQAEWLGEATVCRWQTYFKQSCHTVIDGDTSYKGWRDAWVESECLPPSAQLRLWLQQVQEGNNSYSKKPVIPAEVDEYLPGVTCESYRIDLGVQPVLWSALCDAHLDSLFGGQSLLTSFDSGNVVLYFGTEDRELKAATVSADADDGIMRMAISISRTTQLPSVEIAAGDIVEAVLTEEWSMKRFDFLEPTE